MKREFFYGLFSFLAMALIGATAGSAQPILINELMYHPASAELSEQWLELYNPADTPQELSGWSFTKGISYTFPEGSRIEAGGYLVVASNLEAFRQLYPDVENVLGDWSGNLAKNGENVELSDAQGNSVCKVKYSNQGDWAQRQLTTEEIYNRDGWSWYCEHAGLGKSAELVNPQMPISLGHNWEASQIMGGSPGSANSVSQSLVLQPPLLSEPRHMPAIPHSDEQVALSIRVTTPLGQAATVMAYWREHSSFRFNSVRLHDSGNLKEHGDAVAADGVYSNFIPAQSVGTVVEFYFTAQLAGGALRTYPQVLPNSQGRAAWLAYQVDEESVSPEEKQPFLRLVLSEVEYEYLDRRLWAVGASRALASGTLVYQAPGDSLPEVFYQTGFRNRGNGSVAWNPHNVRIKIPKDQSWEGRTDMNCNTLDVHCQVLGSVLSRLAGLPMAESRPVQLRVNGMNLADAIAPQFGSYAGAEVLNSDFAERQFPNDPKGNLYRGKWHMYSWDPSTSDFSWQGPDWQSYTNAYVKQNNTLQNDWSDLVELMDVLNNTPAEEYESRVRQIIDVEEWMRFFAFNTLVSNQETSLATGHGDDCAMYCGELDRRFRLISYDLDTIMGSGMTSDIYKDGLWRMNALPAIKRFMTHNAFTPLYFKALRELAEGLFAPENMNPLLDSVLGDWVGMKEVARMKAYNANQVEYILSLIPKEFEVSSDFEINKGYPSVTRPDIRFSGKADGERTGAVLVNGVAADYTAWKGEWSIALNLHPGVNFLITQAYDLEGREIAYQESYILYEGGVEPQIIDTDRLRQDLTMTADKGPWLINSDMMIDKNVTLRIEPGTAVYFGTNVRVSLGMHARILAEGTREKPIIFCGIPGGQRWRYITINHVGVSDAEGDPENCFFHVHAKDNTLFFLQALYGSFHLDHMTFGTPGIRYLEMEGCSFMVSNCRFPGFDKPVQLVSGEYGTLQNGRAIFYRNFFGKPSGSHDPVDVTDGSWELSPRFQFIENVFMGSGDDLLDLDGTAAWVEGNILMHTHKDAANLSTGGASAISGGRDEGGTGWTANHYIVGNLFYDVDHAVKSKDGNFHVIAHNTVVRVTPEGGVDTDCGAIGCGDVGFPESLGHYVRDNIFYDVEKLLRDHESSTLTFEGNLMQEPWGEELVSEQEWARGGNNSPSDPRFHYVPSLEETLDFQTWGQAQIMKEWLAPREDSPAKGGGLNGRDKGFSVKRGVSISGEPELMNPQDEVTLTIGDLHTDFGVEVERFPQGAGYLAYRYRINHDGEFGDWSDEYPISEPLRLSGLEEGSYYLEVSGKKHIGMWDHDPRMGVAMYVARSHTWEVSADAAPLQTGVRGVILNELDFGTGQIELFNAGSQAIDLALWSLGDHPSLPGRVTFEPGTTLEAGDYLLAGGGIELPLSLEGGHICLFRGEELMDEVVYGSQVGGYSLGRVNPQSWSLCQPTPGALNIAVELGEPDRLKINEWLAKEQSAFGTDFVELFNPGALPVALGGLGLSDATADTALFTISPHTYIGAGGYLLFIADGDAQSGGNHLNFKLASATGSIALFDREGLLIDSVVYHSEREDISSGRTPDGAARISALSAPTPGGPNSLILAEDAIQIETIELVPMVSAWHFNQNAMDLGTAWRHPGYDDKSWYVGLALFYNETDPLPGPKNTLIRTGIMTHYFRTTFTVSEEDLAQWLEPDSGWVLHLNAIYDDGIVVYLNGEEIIRLNMPDGEVIYKTAAIQSEGRLCGPYEIPMTSLISGVNQLAVELHQNNWLSSDAVMGTELLVERYTPYRKTLLKRPRLSEVFAASDQYSLDGETVYDWVEFYNPEDESVDMSGMLFSRKNSGEAADEEEYWVFPEGTLLEPGAYYLLPCNRKASEGAAPFNLSSSGGTLYLHDSAAAGGALVDSMSYGFQVKDLSVSRCDFFAGSWQLSLPTPGEPAQFCELGSATDIFVNEWMATPLSGGDWFELYNAGELPVELSGYYLSDSLSQPGQYRIPAASYLGVGEEAWIKMMADDELEKGAHHVNFKLSASGEEILLSSPRGQLLELVSFGAQTKGISQGRYPDGNTLVYFFEVPTPGAANIKELPPEELDSDGDGMPDFWEIRYGFNPHDPSDAALDADGDGLTNFEEYLVGSNPLDPEDFLRLQNIRIEEQWLQGRRIAMDLKVVKGRHYRVEYRHAEETEWQLLREIRTVSRSGKLELRESLEGSASCYYRVLLLY
jgi:hypothetical protein